MYKARQVFHSNNLIDKINNLDFLLLFSIFFLGIISIFAQYSSSGGTFDYHAKSHAVRFFVFFFFFLIVSFTKVSFWHQSSFVIYFIFLLLLLLVKYFGITSSGSQRWINLYIINLQPSELMKVGVILFLAKYYHRISAADVNRIRFLLFPLFVIIVPFFLVASQPDLGTSILILSGGVIVVWLAGVRLKFFAYALGLFVATTPIAIAFLKPYQKSRILTFLDPERDPLGAGYQIIQSKIAVGSGGLFGKGFLNGSQSYLDYLPEKHTDFIFTLFSEEFGFFGSLLILTLYAIISFRIAIIGNQTRSIFGKLYCCGFSTAFFIYVAVNMCMVLGLLPIVGAPLPILSYGGSSMLAIMFGLGIAMSCKIFKDSAAN